FLLELLGDFQLSIPEFGTVRAAVKPVVILTSNRTREVHDAIRRRCLYQWVSYPDAAREAAILRRKAPGIAEKLSAEIVAFVQRVRLENMFKPPGVAETIDWAAALDTLEQRELSLSAVEDTLGVLLKYQDDIASLKAEDLAGRVAGAKAAAPAA
ncbi:MAG: ATPase, partial [Rhodospirillales bacterium 20-64-7]